jgi:cobalt-zinc-cadmium efflux system outer membrane protein
MPDPRKPNARARRRRALDRLYPGLPEIGPDPQPVPGPIGLPLTLADLQKLAMSNSPLILQAAADVRANRGALIKAGAYPNPTLGYECDDVGTAGGPGYQGGFIDQVIKTGGKLKLATAMAEMDLRNAQLALRRAQTDLTAQVRSGYFAVLVARENVRVSRALVVFTDRIYDIILQQAKTAGIAAPYEPMQIRVLAYQARGALIQARNRYVSAWKQLAATLGLPAMPLTQLVGRVDMPVPVYDYQKVLAHVLTSHTDVATANNGVFRARYNLRLAQVTAVPDIEVRLMLQKDFTGPPFGLDPSLQVSGPIPIWDINKGGVQQAQGQLVRAVEEPHRVRDDLTTRLADAYERYDDNRKLLEYYANRILPDQLRVYKGVFERHNQKPDEVTFGDIVTAQQTLASAVATYITTLGLEWQAVVDLANLLQTDDLFQMGPEVTGQKCVPPLADLEQLLALPCCHPSSPLPDPQLKGADPTWPPSVPEAGVKNPEVLPQPRKQERRGAPQEDNAVQQAADREKKTPVPADKSMPPVEKSIPPVEKTTPLEGTKGKAPWASLPRRGLTAQPGVAAAQPGKACPPHTVYPEGVAQHEGPSLYNPLRAGAVSSPFSPGCAMATQGCVVKPLRGERPAGAGNETTPQRTNALDGVDVLMPEKNMP